MQRIPYLIEKLSDLSSANRQLTEIDIDLMLDYTRVLYADLLEEKKKLAPQTNINIQTPDTTNTVTESHKTNEETVYTKPMNDLRTVIGINDKYLFISELFSGDKNAYEDAIKQLSEITSTQEAESWILSNLHSKHGWDVEDETVRSFYTLIANSLA